MSTIAVNQITDSSGLSAPVFPPGSAQLNPMAGREDKIINGDFNIWQRGTSFTGAVYSADRWVSFSNSGTVTSSRQAFVLGNTLGANQPVFFLRTTVGGQSAASSIAYISQRVEGVRSYAGQTITVLGWAKRSSGSGNMAFEGYQNFGTGGGSFSNPVNIPSGIVTLTELWAPFAITVSLPSVTGKTIGTDGNDHLGIVFWTSAGSDLTTRASALGLQTIGVDLWGIHIRHGTWTAAATADYRPRDPGTELALCYRYYQVINLTRLNGTTYTPNGDTRARFDYMMPMRIPPLLTQSGTMNVIAGGSAADVINVTLGTITLGGAGVGGGTVTGISNFAAFSSAGGVMTWGDNAGGAFTVYADAEL